MAGLFNGNSIFNQPIGDWDTSKVTDMSYMFENAIEFNQNPSTWNVANVTNHEDFNLDANPSWVSNSAYQPSFTP